MRSVVMRAVMILMIAITIVSLLLACGQFDPSQCNGSFYIDHTKFTLKQEEDIQVAADRWNAFLGYNYFRIEDGGTCAITVQSNNQPADEVAAYYQYYPVIARKNSFIAFEPATIVQIGGKENPKINDEFQSIMLHEMFHSIGGQHIPKGPAIITSTISSDDFTQADLLECVNIGMCNR